MERSSGILLPVFSLPGAYGIGTLGREARAFADFLRDAGQRWWQVLPVGPTGAGNSPYTSASTFAGNPLLIDLEDLRDRGLLTEAELSAARVEPDGYMYLTGRKKNVIILGSGENVSPEELEKLLAPCAAIRECRVCERNQRICAVVCCEADQQDAVRDFVTKVNRTLPLYKHMMVEFSAQPLPRNAAGKLLRS